MVMVINVGRLIGLNDGYWWLVTQVYGVPMVDSGVHWWLIDVKRLVDGGNGNYMAIADGSWLMVCRGYCWFIITGKDVCQWLIIGNLGLWWVTVLGAGWQVVTTRDWWLMMKKDCSKDRYVVWWLTSGDSRWLMIEAYWCLLDSWGLLMADGGEG